MYYKWQKKENAQEKRQQEQIVKNEWTTSWLQS